MPSMSRLAFWATTLFVFSVPWERTVHVPGAGAAGSVFGAIAFALMIVSLVQEGRVRLRRPALVLPVMALFVAWSALTYFWSIQPNATLGRTATYTQLFLMVWLIWQVSRGERDFRIHLQAFVFGCLVAIAAVFVNFVRGDATVVATWSGLTRFSFGGGDPNYLALTLVLGIPMAWMLVLREPNRARGFLNMAYIPLAVIVVGLTGSRGGTLSALIALMIIPVTYWHLRLGRKILLLAALAGIAYGALYVVPDVTLERLVATPQDIQMEDLSGRSDIWRAGLEYLDTHQGVLLRGSGSGTFSSAVEHILGRRATAHNAYLNVLVDNGIVGLTLFLAMFAIAVWPNLLVTSRSRSFALFLILCLGVGVFALSWEREKPLWITIALLASYRAIVVDPDREGPGSDRSEVRDSSRRRTTGVRLRERTP